MSYPEYGTSPASAEEKLDPIKAHAALCAAIAIQKESGASEYNFENMAAKVERYLRGKR